jgi:hypothetical protein
MIAISSPEEEVRFDRKVIIPRARHDFDSRFILISSTMIT